jgi:20S proteasome alpha/beta subunit
VTLLVGILCKDGVVMGSDSAATFGASGIHTIGQQEVLKVQRLNDHILYSATGAIGVSQLVADKLQRLWAPSDFRSPSNPDEVMNRIGREILSVTGAYLQSATWLRALGRDDGTSVCKSLVAMPVGDKPQLYQFDANGAPERTMIGLPFVSLGSGQLIADPFLALLKRLLWKDTEPTLAEGRLAAVWTIDHVNRTNPGGVGGHIQLAILANAGGNEYTTSSLSEADVDEHLNRVASAERLLVRELRQEVVAPPPPPAPADAEVSRGSVLSDEVPADLIAAPTPPSVSQ